MELFWSHLIPSRFPGRRSEMPVDLSIKRVPDFLVERLRKRADLNHRSLQGELIAMLEEHLLKDGPLTLAQLSALNRALGFHTPSESVEMIRADRDDPLRGEPR
jgi:hypothetical protein